MLWFVSENPQHVWRRLHFYPSHGLNSERMNLDEERRRTFSSLFSSRFTLLSQLNLSFLHPCQSIFPSFSLLVTWPWKNESALSLLLSFISWPADMKGLPSSSSVSLFASSVNHHHDWTTIQGTFTTKSRENVIEHGRWEGKMWVEWVNPAVQEENDSLATDPSLMMMPVKWPGFWSFFHLSHLNFAFLFAQVNAGKEKMCEGKLMMMMFQRWRGESDSEERMSFHFLYQMVSLVAIHAKYRK